MEKMSIDRRTIMLGSLNYDAITNMSELLVLLRVLILLCGHCSSNIEDVFSIANCKGTCHNLNWFRYLKQN